MVDEVASEDALTDTTTNAPTEPPVVVPTFSLNYLSPADNITLVDLTCQESTQAKATAFCQGKYTTTPAKGAREGYEVKVTCEIIHGASSGPGCSTTVKDPTGPGTHQEYTQHLYPASGVGPASLASWEQEYLTFLQDANSALYASLTSSQPATPKPRASLTSPQPASPRHRMPGLDRERAAGVPFPSDQDLRTAYIEKMTRSRDISSEPKSSSPACARTDFKCRVLRLEMLTPPTDLEPVTNLVPDLCAPTSLCGTWRHFRNFVSREFSKKLNNDTFRLGTFKSDTDSMWSKQGAKLWSEAQNMAADKQQLGPTYLAQLQMKTTLSLLAETRNLRLEQLDNSAMLWVYVLGLGIPGVLLTALYMTLTCRTFWKTRKNTQLRKRLRREEEEEILRVARPGLQLKIIPKEQGRLLNNGRPA